MEASAQIYEPQRECPASFDSSYQGDHLAFWQQGVTAGSITAESRDKWIQTEPHCLKACPLEAATTAAEKNTFMGA